MKADRYIPVHYDELVETLARDRLADRAETFTTFAWLLENLVEYEHAEREESLKKKYVFFSPDDDTITNRKPDEAERAALKAAFLEELDQLFDRANFETIGKEDFEAALREGTTEGLKIQVNLDAYEEFRIYFRGTRILEGFRRNWRTLYRKRKRQVEVYSRAATVTKLASEPYIYLKLFKEIPSRDIESLLPGTKVKMRLFDKLKIGGSTGAAVFTAVRTALKGVVFLGKSFIVPLTIGFIGLYLGKTIFSWFNMRDKYRTRIIRDLFYQNLDNNLGVINGLVDSSEEEEATEALLAYAFALTEGEAATPDHIKARVEEFLAGTWKALVDFEVVDALDKLTALGVVTMEEGRVKAQPLPEACRLLDERWDGLFTPPGKSPA